MRRKFYFFKPNKVNLNFNGVIKNQTDVVQQHKNKKKNLEVDFI